MTRGSAETKKIPYNGSDNIKPEGEPFELARGEPQRRQSVPRDTRQQKGTYPLLVYYVPAGPRPAKLKTKSVS